MGHDPLALRVGLQWPRLRFGLVCGLLTCLALGCSRAPNATDIEHIRALGGRADTDPADKEVVMVWLTGTDADDDDMQIVARFPKLRYLNLVGMQLTDEGVKRLTGLSNLEALDAYNTAITDAGVASLANLTALSHLLIGKTKITDAALSSLTSMPNLEELRLEGTAITDAGMTALAKMPQLRTLYLDDTKITDAGLEKLCDPQAGAPKLEFLSLCRTQIDDGAVQTLSAMTSLRTLAVRDSRLSRGGAAAIRKALPMASLDWPPISTANIVAEQGVIRIKAGSAVPFTDSNGNAWLGELGFDAGGMFGHDEKMAIDNTKDPGLYRSEHYSA